MRLGRTAWVSVVCALMPFWGRGVFANQAPVANAGVDRYLDAQPLTLDGGASFDSDGVIVSYAWSQISGPALQLSGANTVSPTVTATPNANAIGIAVLQLIVNDGEVDSSPDTIQLTIVQAVPGGIQLTLENPPFDVNKPTGIFFLGGNCVTGGGAWGMGPEWEARANIISFVYGPPYDRPADAVIAYLSRVAPNYAKPIQTSGWSTGGMPAVDSAVRLNKIFHDSRYTVSLINLLDAACRNYDASILEFLNNPVAGNSSVPWIQNFFSSSAGFGSFKARCVNVTMVGDHSLPPSYYIYSIYPFVFTTDLFNHGLTAGAFTSVVEHGTHYRMPNLVASPYYFKLVFDTPETVHLEQNNAVLYPGRLPEPIALSGPVDGGSVGIAGATLGCATSENSVAYDFLFGASVNSLSVRFTSSSPPSIVTGFLPHGATFFWTMQARDGLGTSYRADVFSFSTPGGLKVDVNGDGAVDSGDCGAIQGAFGTHWGSAGFQLAADYNGDGVIDCVDYFAWLSDYRAHYGNPNLADPCGLTSAADQDADGVPDQCDSCPGTVPGVMVDAHGCPPVVPGDFDVDGDVDQSDFGRLQACLSNPRSSPLIVPGCEAMNVNHDSSINTADMDLILNCLSGADVGGNPGCGG